MNEKSPEQQRADFRATCKYKRVDGRILQIRDSDGEKLPEPTELFNGARRANCGGWLKNVKGINAAKMYVRQHLSPGSVYVERD